MPRPYEQTRISPPDTYTQESIGQLFFVDRNGAHESEHEIDFQKFSNGYDTHLPELDDLLADQLGDIVANNAPALADISRNHITSGSLSADFDRYYVSTRNHIYLQLNYKPTLTKSSTYSEFQSLNHIISRPNR